MSFNDGQKNSVEEATSGLPDGLGPKANFKPENIKKKNCKEPKNTNSI